MKQIILDPTGKTVEKVRSTTDKTAIHFTNGTVFLLSADIYHVDSYDPQPYIDYENQMFKPSIYPNSASDALQLDIITQEEYDELEKEFEKRSQESTKLHIENLKQEIADKQKELDRLITIERCK